MAFHRDPVDLEYDDDDLLDRMSASYEPPSYPYGCQFSLAEDDLEQAAGEKGRVGDVMRFAAMAEVTSVYSGTKDSRIELKINEFAGDDGKFFEITKDIGDKDDFTYQRFGCLCLGTPELQKMGLEADCELGDLIHLIGDAKLESVSRTEKGGDIASLQITRLTFAEDESTESQEG